MRVYGCDFETDNDGLGKAWVVQYCITDGKKFYTGESVKDFMIDTFRILKKHEAIFYFHNLKYDLEFLKYGLKDACDKKGCKLKVTMRDNNPIQIKLIPSYESGMKELSIRDSAKKIDGDLRSIGKLIGLEKLEGYDFEAGWSNSIDLYDEENWKYVKRDAEIVAIAMQKLHEQGYTHSTLSGDAWSEVKTILATDKNGKVHLNNNLKFQRYFPKLDIKLDLALREGYDGGINLSFNKGVNDEDDLIHADVKSMYPSVMMYDKLPYGKPTYTLNKPVEGALYVVKANVKFKLKEGKIPWYHFKHLVDNSIEGLEMNAPVIKCKEWHYLTLTNYDIENLSLSYDIEYDESIDKQYWVFKSRIGILKEYIEKYQAKKNAEKEGTLMYLHAKKMQNAVYGRTGLNPTAQETTLEYDENGNLIWKKDPYIQTDNDAYLPFAMFVTSAARKRLLEYVNKLDKEEIIHSDTDSVIHKGGKKEGVEYGSKLGNWEEKGCIYKIYEGGFKRYIEILEPEIKSLKSFSIACAGVPQKKDENGLPIGMWVELLDCPEIILTDKELGQKEYKIKSKWLRDEYIKYGKDPDRVNTFKLLPQRVEGGIILRESTYKLKDNLVWRLKI